MPFPFVRRSAVAFPSLPQAHRQQGAIASILALGLMVTAFNATAQDRKTVMTVAFHVQDVCTVTAENGAPTVDCSNRIAPQVEQREQRVDGVTERLTVVTW